MQYLISITLHLNITLNSNSSWQKEGHKVPRKFQKERLLWPHTASCTSFKLKSAKDLNDIETCSMEYYFTFYPVFNHTHANIRISLDLIPSTYLAVDAHSSSIKPAEGV